MRSGDERLRYPGSDGTKCSHQAQSAFLTGAPVQQMPFSLFLYHQVFGVTLDHRGPFGSSFLYKNDLSTAVANRTAFTSLQASLNHCFVHLPRDELFLAKLWQGNCFRKCFKQRNYTVVWLEYSQKDQGVLLLVFLSHRSYLDSKQESGYNDGAETGPRPRG